MREFAALLAPWEANVLFPPHLDLCLDVSEDGETYAENARQKAQAYAEASGLLTLADDSGLEVEALGGAPGLHSARYVEGADLDRLEALLTQLSGVPPAKRTARFRCVLVVVSSSGEELCRSEGVCEGMISLEPAGAGGFGYDPVFYIPQYEMTMAQVSSEIKNRISHRARAVQAARPALDRLLREERENA
jgi:XTP/dITP diphosphohydrolase